MMASYQNKKVDLLRDPKKGLELFEDTAKAANEFKKFTCRHQNKLLYADHSSKSVGTIYWCPDCGAISIDGEWTYPK